MKVVIAGGSGFIGHALVDQLATAGYEVVVLSRSKHAVPGARTVEWDGRTVGAWSRELDDARAVVNLAGSSLLRRWNHAAKREILESRVEPTRAIGAALITLRNPPPVWVNASAVGYYGDRGDERLSEQIAHGTGFLGQVCLAWEDAQSSCSIEGVRKVRVRIGLPLSREGGALPVFVKLARWFVGSAMGTGRQWVPWIDVDDLASMFQWSIENEVEGAVNGTGPEPVRNADFMENLRTRFGRPWVPPVPGFALNAAHVFGAPPPQLALMSSRVVPEKPLAMGFRFQCETLDQSLDRQLRNDF